MSSSCRRLFQHRRSSSNRHKARSHRHKIDRGAAAARQVPGRHYATQYHMIYLPDPASFFWKYCFAARTGRRRARPSALTRPRGCRRPVRRASPGSSPRRSPLLFRFRRAGAGRWGLLVFGPSSLFLLWCGLLICFLTLRTESIHAPAGRSIYLPARALGRRGAKAELAASKTLPSRLQTRFFAIYVASSVPW